jgi:hypothetical protein
MPSGSVGAEGATAPETLRPQDRARVGPLESGCEGTPPTGKAEGVAHA